MIQIVRNVYMDELRPAGIVFYQDSKDEVKDACSFLWGRDCKFYNVYVNGHPVDIKSGELGEIQKQMEKYYE